MSEQKTLEKWSDLRIHTTFELGEDTHCVHFACYDALVEDNDDPEPTYMDTFCNYVSSIEEALPCVKGTIKWDGCSHMDFGNKGYLHFCRPRQAKNLGEILWRVYAKAYEMLVEHRYFEMED